MTTKQNAIREKQIELGLLYCRFKEISEIYESLNARMAVLIEDIEMLELNDD